MSGIVRIQRNRPGAYIPNETAHDARLPLDSLGLLTTILAHDDSWQVSMKHLLRTLSGRTARGAGGEEWLARMMKNLEAAGYCHRSRERGVAGRWRWVSTVTDISTAAPGSAGGGLAATGSARYNTPKKDTHHQTATHHPSDAPSTPSSSSPHHSFSKSHAPKGRGFTESEKKRLREEIERDDQLLHVVGRVAEFMEVMKNKRKRRAFLIALMRQLKIKIRPGLVDQILVMAGEKYFAQHGVVD